MHTELADLHSNNTYSSSNWLFPQSLSIVCLQAFDNVSDDAKKFIEELLCVDMSQRLTAENALRHSWIVPNSLSIHWFEIIISSLHEIKVTIMSKSILSIIAHLKSCVYIEICIYIHLYLSLFLFIYLSFSNLIYQIHLSIYVFICIYLYFVLWSVRELFTCM